MPDIPPELEVLVMRLLEKDPARRHADAYHVLEELRAIGETLPRPSTLPTIPQIDAAALFGAQQDHVVTREVPRQPSSNAPEAWARRLLRLRELSAKAHPEGPPVWLTEAFVELDARVAELGERRAELDAAATAARKHEEEARNVRLRLGRAVDVLGRDESRLLRELEELSRAHADARQRLAHAEPQLREAWRTLPPPGAALTLPAAEAVERAGLAAGKWLEASRAAERLAADITRLERERDDVRFQVAQLKGRLGTLGAEVEYELAELRERMRRMDEAAQTLSDRTAPIFGAHRAALPLVPGARRRGARRRLNRGARRASVVESRGRPAVGVRRVGDGSHEARGRAHGSAGGVRLGFTSRRRRTCPRRPTKRSCGSSIRAPPPSAPRPPISLGRRGYPRRAAIVPLLRQRLRDDRDWRVRASSGRAIGRLGARDAVPDLVRALRDPVVDVRVVAAAALWRLPDPAAVPALLELLRDADPSARQWGALALGVIRDRRATRPLIGLLADPRPTCAPTPSDRSGASATRRRPPPSGVRGRRVARVRGAPRGRGRARGARRSREGGRPRAPPCATTKAAMRARAVSALGRVGDALVVPPLRQRRAAEPSAAVRSAIDQAIRDIQARAASGEPSQDTSAPLNLPPLPD
ncbi:MAG: HEAT repeat domain-containing protein [Sandaracinaceae bacterium]|nr:HEAT repeat domain-containing protein [Sandaracinaceae bacterium]